jgi:protein TonB
MTATPHMKDEFDLLLDDVLHSVANPELPERVRVQVRTRVWITRPKRPAVVFAPEVFLSRMQPQRDARSTAFAVLAHAAAIALIFWASYAHVRFAAPAKQSIVTNLTPPPEMPKLQDRMGGGGGQRGPAPVSKGQLPKFAETQITPPKAPPMDQPKIRMPEPTIEVQKDLKMADNNLPNLGMPNSPLLGASMGNGAGSGLGTGNGSGLGPGSGGNYGGGLRHVGGGVSAPVVIFKVEPEFSEEARKAKFMGVVTVNLIVDTAGRAQNVRVIRGVGMGLDQKALEAVRQYRFKPAMEGGHPVPVQVNVEVQFQIF